MADHHLTEDVQTKPVTLLREHSDAVWRVLGLLDKFMATQPQKTLHAVDGGLFTIQELRQHLKAARKLLPKERAT